MNPDLQLVVSRKREFDGKFKEDLDSSLNPYTMYHTSEIEAHI